MSEKRPSYVGGHKFTCGHEKWCYDHVQMVKEDRCCHACEIVLDVMQKEGKNIRSAQNKRLGKKIVDAFLLKNSHNKDLIW